MLSAKTRSYVRTWHHRASEDHTGRPLLIVTYRFALDKFVRFTNYTLVYYDDWSRRRIRNMTMNDRCLSIVLKQEPVLVKLKGDQTFAKKPRLVFFEPRRLQQGLFVLTVGLVFRLDTSPPPVKTMTKEEWKRERKISKKEEEEDEVREEEDEKEELAEAERKALQQKKVVIEQPKFVAEKRKMTFKEKHEYETLEKEIAELEDEKVEVEKQLSDSSNNQEYIIKFSLRFESIKNILEEKSIRWLELSELLS